MGWLKTFVLAGLLWGGTAAWAADQTPYWDDPVTLVRQEARFPQTVSNAHQAAVFWQERRSADGWAQTFLSVAVRKEGDQDWTLKRRVLGPFTLSGTEAQVYSSVLAPSGTFWTAVLENDGQVHLFRSDDGADTFREEAVVKSSGNLLVPRLFWGTGNEPLLVVGQAEDRTFRLAASRRISGTWTPLRVITDDEKQTWSFQPSVTVLGTKLLMTYQAVVEGSRLNYQIFRQESADGGETWTPAQRVTTWGDDLDEEPDKILNQRPSALWYQGRLFLAWERQTNKTQPVIEVASFDAAGKRLDAQALTAPNSSARSPLFYLWNGQLHLSWFDNRSDSYDLYEAAWDPETGWGDTNRLTKDAGNAVFGQAAQVGGDLYFFWQDTFGDHPSLVFLGPDRRAEAPTLTAADFKPGAKTRRSDFTIDLTFPRDVSGIAGWSFLVTRDPAAEPPHVVARPARDRRWTGRVGTEEGPWYLAAAVADQAGNWSPAARVSLDLKTTPPGPVLFTPPATDSRGYLPGNTFRLAWTPTTPDAVAYSFRWRRLGDGLTQAVVSRSEPLEASPAPTGTDPWAEANNFENGLWALTVQAFDEAGNRGPAATRLVRLNKFQPYTILRSVDADQDAFGRVKLVIHGRGFTAGGDIDHVYIDADGQAPFDYDLRAGAFHVASDTLIDGISVEGLAEGLYRIGVHHPARGQVFTGPVLRVEPTGTVKVGDYRPQDKTVWDFIQGVSFYFSVNALPFWGALALLAAAAWASLVLLGRSWADRHLIRRQASAWFADNPDKWALRAGSSAMEAKGMSLTVKFAASILGLTVSVVLMLSLTLGFFITENSQVSLGQALRQRTQVLLESLATGARTYLPTGNTTELGYLPAQIAAMENEALWATITGPSSEKKAGLSFVYASNDPDLKDKIDTAILQPGTSLLRSDKDPVEPVWEELQQTLEQEAEAAVGDLTRQIETVHEEGKALVGKTDEASSARLKELGTTEAGLRRQVIAALAKVGGQARSWPAFEPRNLLASKTKEYLFYQPFLYYTLGDPRYVRGLVRIEVSSKVIEAQITASRDQLILVTAVVALIAVVLGLIGAFVLSALTINPIRKLVAGVAKIRDTEDKAELADHIIDIRTRDELATLAATVNQMTQGLVHAAEANKDLMLGKATQKTFIPLDTDPKGRKMTTGYLDLEEAEIFGYYEGAKGVSGDYYDFRQLDNKDGGNPKSPWYGFIKCDVSGKGIVGALIMFTVASVVVNFFRNWTAARDSKDIQLKGMVANINDLLESLNFRGRFAALNTGVLNVKTGKVRLCHAGDNVVHVWRGKKGVFETTTLPGAPATGQIADFMARDLYKHFDLTLEPGDTLLFYTDGIEESKGYFRDSDWNIIAFEDPDKPETLVSAARLADLRAKAAEKTLSELQREGLKPGPSQRTDEAINADRTYVTGLIDNEPFHDPPIPATPPSPRNPDGIPAKPGNPRHDAIFEAFYRRGTYRLVKKYPARPEATFTFDFSTCDGSAKQVVTALISMDRVFRIVADPRATAEDKIKLDVIQNEFLKEHFVEYGQYFKDPKPDPEYAEYVWFSHLKEDDQFDDLTLLAIRKK